MGNVEPLPTEDQSQLFIAIENLLARHSDELIAVAVREYHGAIKENREFDIRRPSRVASRGEHDLAAKIVTAMIRPPRVDSDEIRQIVSEILDLAEGALMRHGVEEQIIVMSFAEIRLPVERRIEQFGFHRISEARR